MTDRSEAEGPTRDQLLTASAEIVAAYVGQNQIQATTLPDLIRSIHTALTGLGATAPAPAERPKPAVPIGRSVQHDYIVCLEDGMHLKMLKRYLRSHFDMSPEDYRRRWGLPPDYPMVAPAYAERRSEFAKKIGLGKGVRRRTSRSN
jgi:predicted transcriptional regulator